MGGNAHDDIALRPAHISYMGATVGSSPPDNHEHELTLNALKAVPFLAGGRVINAINIRKGSWHVRNNVRRQTKLFSLRSDVRCSTGVESDSDLT